MNLVIFFIFVTLNFLLNVSENNNFLACIGSDKYLLFSSLLPLKVYKDLNKPEKFKVELHKLGGVYGLVNMSDPYNIKQYIGSSKDLYKRLSDHLKGRESNSRLQRSIFKYGLHNFYFCIYYWHTDPSVILTDIETEVIKSFLFENLYNYKREASSSLGYKHTIEAIKKMKKRFLNKSTHPSLVEIMMNLLYLKLVNLVF